jgi:hypothetical protein
LWRGPGGEGVREKLAKAGSEEIDLEPTRVYRAEDARAFLAARSSGDAWPVITVSMTAYATEASCPRKIGQACVRIPTGMDGRFITGRVGRATRQST